MLLEEEEILLPFFTGKVLLLTDANAAGGGRVKGTIVFDLHRR